MPYRSLLWVQIEIRTLDEADSKEVPLLMRRVEAISVALGKSIQSLASDGIKQVFEVQQMPALSPEEYC
jgi:hypothetical protein